MAEAPGALALPSSKDHFFNAGQYFQSVTTSIRIERSAEEMFNLFTENGLANWKSIFPGSADFERVKGGPGPKMAVGDVLQETVRGLGTDFVFDYTVTGLVPGRTAVLEGRSVYEGITNPKGCAIAIWMFFPESETSCTVTRYFTALLAEDPGYLVPASDPALMQEMFEGLKAAAESMGEEGFAGAAASRKGSS